MKHIAIIGSGISGLTAAYLLSKKIMLPYLKKMTGSADTRRQLI